MTYFPYFQLYYNLFFTVYHIRPQQKYSMSDSFQELKMRLALKGKNIQMPLKLNLKVSKLVKLNWNHINSYQAINQPPMTEYGRNSLSTLPKKLESISRKSFDSHKIDYKERRFSEQNKSTNIVQDEIIHKEPLMLAMEKNKTKNDSHELHFHLRRYVPSKAKKCTCGDCAECLKDFNYFLNIFSSDISLPEISAKSWCIWRRSKNGKFVHYYGKRIHKVRQIASLTKMITAIVAIDVLKTYDYDPNKIFYKVRKSSTLMKGTSAFLQEGQIYSITQLLYGLMLPSGNDAAIAIAQAIGLIYEIKLKNKRINPYTQTWYEDYIGNSNKTYSFHFIALMNEKCTKIGLLDTKMYNSHGNDAYNQLKNVSTCNQVAKISVQFMQKYQELKTISNTKSYQVERYSKKWQNTNKLLDDGFQGIKTGINESSGPCLAAYYKELIIIVLNSKSMNERWIQVKKLVRWIVRKGT